MSHIPAWLDPVIEGVRLGLRQARLPHALLLIGREGDGLHRLGRYLGHTILCRQPERPCGTCKTCLLVQGGAHPDLMTLEPEGKSDTIKVAQVRELQHFMHETPQQGGNKVIRLVRADRMNNSAANALLKMLEEPTPNTFLVLESASLSRLLPTVRSRCRLYKLDHPAPDQARDYLSSLSIPDEEIGQRLAMAQGAPLEAAEFTTDAIERWNKQITAFHREREFSALAAFINQQPPNLLLEQLLMWVDTALRIQHKTDVSLPEHDAGLVRALSSVPAMSLFGFRDYILELLNSLRYQANLNQQMWSEQLAARWLEITSQA